MFETGKNYCLKHIRKQSVWCFNHGGPNKIFNYQGVDKDISLTTPRRVKFKCLPLMRIDRTVCKIVILLMERHEMLSESLYPPHRRKSRKSDAAQTGSFLLREILKGQFLKFSSPSSWTKRLYLSPI